MICIYRKEIEKEDKNSVLWGPNYSQASVLFVEKKVKNGEEIDINDLDINLLNEEMKGKL